MARRRTLIVVVLALLSGVVLSLAHRGPRSLVMRGTGLPLAGKATVLQRVEQFGPAVRTRMAAHFHQAGLAYPPEELVLVGIKDAALLEVWGRPADGPFRRIVTYPIAAASGTLGPKLREGDRQVPEGLYTVESLNPNSRYHLALRVGYPNDFDRRMAAGDGRTNLGGNIMIHGGSASIGCLAMGDQAVEDLFILAAETGFEHVRVILAPVDFRSRNLPADMPPTPAWTAALYQSIRQELAELRTE